MNTFYAVDRKIWRDWLSEHFESEQEIWLVFPTKASGEKSVSYNDAVEEALCFGWIDGRAGTLDETHHIRRFTPRRKGSTYSQPNIERLIWLDKRSMLLPQVRESVKEMIEKSFVFPPDIIAAIQSDEEAWKNYLNFAEPYKRIRVAYIDAARKRPGEFRKRLESFIGKTRENKLIVGYGGIEKYYAGDLRVISYYKSDGKAHWLKEIEKSDWSASAFLHRLLSENTFFEVMGERSEVLLLADGDKLVSHCTFAERDDIQPTDLTPWVGFVYTFPEYRGHRYAGLLLDEAERLAKARGIPAIYLSTNHIGLYEKYGFEFLDMMNDIDGEPSRVYIKRTD